MSDRTPARHAVVIGGSMGGLLAARVLADRYDRVTVLERDKLPAGPDPRKGTPQARHIHVLLTAGRRALERLFPGLVRDLVAAGAEDYDAVADVEWLSPAGRSVRFPSGIRLLGASRDLIEWGVRTRVAADGRIRVRTGVDVSGLRLDPTGSRVIGLNLEDRPGLQGGRRPSTRTWWSMPRAAGREPPSGWRSTATRHKTEHLNDEENPDLDRKVYLGPKCQQLLKEWMTVDADAFLFTPSRSESLRNALRKQARTTPMTPSQAARKPKGRSKASFLGSYGVESYRQAIRHAGRAMRLTDVGGTVVRDILA